MSELFFWDVAPWTSKICDAAQSIPIVFYLCITSLCLQIFGVFQGYWPYFGTTEVGGGGIFIPTIKSHKWRARYKIFFGKLFLESVFIRFIRPRGNFPRSSRSSRPRRRTCGWPGFRCPLWLKNHKNIDSWSTQKFIPFPGGPSQWSCSRCP